MKFNKRYKIIIAIFFLFAILQGCAVGVVKLLGIGEAATAVGAASEATTALEIAETVDLAKTAGDAVSYQKTGKTLTDHIISGATGKDCRLIRKLKGDGDYCIDETIPELEEDNK